MPMFQPSRFLTAIVQPACALLPYPNTRNVQRWMVAVAKQESGLKSRFQELKPGTDKAGAAKGWWQCERISIQDNIEHPKTKDVAADVAELFVVANTTDAVHRAIEGHDLLAACHARMILWKDPHNVPDSEDAAWDTYIKMWKPGAPDRTRWTAAWRLAVDLVPLV